MNFLYTLRLSLRAKILLLCFILILIPTLSIGFVASSIAEREILAQAEQNLASRAGDAVNTMRGFDQAVKRGDMTISQAQDEVRRLFRPQKVGKTGYIFVINGRGEVVVHPVRAWVNVSDQGFIKEMLEKKQGTVRFNWVNQELGELSDREKVIAYDYYPDWDWIVAIGTYVDELTGPARTMRIWALGASAAALAVGLALAIVLVSVLTRNVRALMIASEHLAAGDLTYRAEIRSGDEIGKLAETFNHMAQELRHLVSQVVRNSESVASTSSDLSRSAVEAHRITEDVAGRIVDELSLGNKAQMENVSGAKTILSELSEAIGQIAAGAQEQSRGVSEASEAVARMVTVIDQVNEAARGLAEASRETSGAAETGGQAARKSIEGMGAVRETVLQSAGRVRELGEISGRIGEIVRVINDISDQTNLLALNAAIEAARAGEHGRGFAVVADEVRKLAERSGKATSEIADLIAGIQRGVKNAVEAMEAGTTKAEEGARLSEEAGTALAAILANVVRTGEQIDRISAAARELGESSSLVVRSVETMASITEENTAATEEMAAGSSQVMEAMKSVEASAANSTRAASDAHEAISRVSGSAREIAASAESLAEMARSLKEAVARFKIQ